MQTLVIIPATVVGVLAAYFLARALLGSPVPQDTKDLAASVGFRIASLHGLIIALVFAQLALVFRNIEDGLIQESGAVRSIYFDAERHGGPGAAEIMDDARSYVSDVLDREWREPGKEVQMSKDGQAQIDDMFDRALALPAATPTQQALRDGLLAEVRRLSDLREEREGHTRRTDGAPFWFASISGLALLAACFAPFEPTKKNLALLVGFALYSGIIFALIHSYQNPFTPPGAVLPIGFERLREAMG